MDDIGGWLEAFLVYCLVLTSFFPTAGRISYFISYWSCGPVASSPQSIMWYVLLPKKNYPSNLTLNLLTSKSKFKLSKLLSIYFLKEHYLRGFVSRFKWFSLRLSFCQFVYGQTTDTRLLFWTVCFFPVERKHLKVLTFSLNLPHIIWTPRQYEHFLRPSVSELLCFGHHFTVT